MSDTTIGNGSGTYNISPSNDSAITVGNGNDTVTVTGATDDSISIGNGNDTVTLADGSHNAISVGNGNDTVNASGDTYDTITLGNGNQTVVMGVSDTVNIGNGNGAYTLTAGQDATINIGNGNHAVSVAGGAQDVINIGNGNNTVTVTGAADSTITAGNGNDTINAIGGSLNTITVGNGNVAVVANSEHNDTITAGNGNDTIYIGLSDTVTVGRGNDLVVLPAGNTSLTAPNSLSVLEDHSIPLNISAAIAAKAIGQDKIYGFAAADQLQFTTAQFANLAAVMAAAKQVGANTVITLDASDSITLENVQLSNLQSKNFKFVAAPSGAGSNFTVTISGVPADATLTSTSDPSGVTYNAATQTWNVADAALGSLMLNAGEVTAATLQVMATNSTTGFAVTQNIALTVNAVAPTLSVASTTLSVKEDGTVALGIGETPFDPRDTVSITIAGVPSDATLSSGTNNGNGIWTLTPAQLSGLTLTAGEVTTANLIVTATNTEGVTASSSQSIALSVIPVAPTLSVASSTLSVNEDGTVALGIGETPFDPRDAVSITIAGVPSDATLSSGTNNGNGTWVLTPAQLSGLRLTAGEVTTANLIVTATNTEGATASTSQSIALTVNPVAPGLTTPTSLTVNADSSVALNIGETPFDPRDTVSIAITGVPSDATLSAGTNNGNGTWTLTPAQLVGLTLNAGQATVATLEVTATNTQGVTASTSEGIALTVNPVLNLTMGVIGNLAVQQGQTLVATATISGDNTDANAAVNYQWQSSSDGGVTWSNVGGAVAGDYDQGILSSFLQLTEQDEGQQFRVVASFTDYDGNVIATTSSPTVPVADITPEITVPFSYTVSDLSIVKNGTQIYNDTFSAPPVASTAILANGVPKPQAFATLGGTWTESNGQAVMSSTGVAPNPVVSGSVEDFAKLITNTDPTSTAGLKEGASFTVSSTLGLTTPPAGSYGMELGDGANAHGVDQLERLIVTTSGGNTIVELVQANLTTDPITETVLASQTLTAAQLADNNQIEFQFSHTANTQAVTGSFELLDNGAVNATTTFSPQASIFTNGVDWTTVDIGAFLNPGVALNVAAGHSPKEGQTLTASATTNDSDATINYQWQESNNNGTTWTDIGVNSPNYVVQESDENDDIRVVASTSDPDNSQSATVTSAATGPVIDNASLSVAIKNPAQEGQLLNAQATITGDPSDLTAPVTYQWQTSIDGGTTWNDVPATTMGTINNMPASFYQLQESDEGNIFRVVASFTDDTGQVVTATSLPTAPVADIAPIVTTPFSYAVDAFKIVKGDGTSFDDTFSNGPPPVGGLFGTELDAFGTDGSVWTADNGQAILSASGAVPGGAGAVVQANLSTNTQPEGTGDGESEDGLKEDQTFVASGIFDLANVTAQYGIDLTNGTPVVPTTEFVQLFVASAGGGNAKVVLQQGDPSTNTYTQLATFVLSATQVANNSQIELDLAHNEANSSAITGSFELIENGTQTFTDTFSTTAHAFNNQTYTRAGMFATAGSIVTISGIAQEGQTLTANAATNDSDATINYRWQESASPSFAAFTVIGANNPTYTEQESDVGSYIRVVATTSDPDNSQSATATSQVTGPVLPVAPGLSAPSPLTMSEDGTIRLPIAVTPFNPSDPVDVTISGIPSDVSLSDSAGALDTSSGSVTLTQVQLAGLTVTAGKAETATLTVTATNEAGATASTTQNIFFNATPVAPMVTISPSSVSVNEDGTVALPITVTPFDSRDNIEVVIGFVPSGDTLTDGEGDTFPGGGPGPTATLSLAQFDSGVSLTVGPQIPGAPIGLSVQAYDNSNGFAIAPEQFLPVTVNPVAPALSAPASLSVNEDGTVPLGISETPYDPNDTVSITIAGLPSDATLSAGTSNGSGVWTLTPGQLAGLTLTAGGVTTANLTVAAANTAGLTASTSDMIALTVDQAPPVLGGTSAQTATEGGSVTLGITDTVAFADDTLGNVTITGLPANSSNFNGGSFSGTTWSGTAAQFSALSFTAGNAGTYTLAISATTSGADAGSPATGNYTLTVNQAAPVLGGAASDTVIEGGSVALGAVDTAAFSDDTLGNVTITGLPGDLTGFNGGSYTATPATELVNFDSINTAGGAVFGTPVTNYLAGYGITFSSSNGTPYILPYVAGNPFPNAVSTPNYYSVDGPDNGFTYTLSFAAPENSVSFTVPGTGNTSTMAAWSATAYSAANIQLAEVGDPNVTEVNSSTQTYTLNGPGIAYVVFSDNVENFAGNHFTFDNLMLDTTPTGTWTGTAAQFNDLSFDAGGVGTSTLSISATTSGIDSGASVTENYTLTVDQAAPVLGGATSDTVTEGGPVTLGATDTVAFADDMLGDVTITGLPTNLTGINGGTYTASSGTWIGTAAQFNALKFTTATAGTSTLSIAATTAGEDGGAPATENYTLTVDQAAPVLGGSTSDAIAEGLTVTLSATDTAAHGDDTLGNVTITGLPTNLTGFNGGTYTASSGTWVGTASQFNALKFTTASAGTSTLSISATTTGTDAGSPATETYSLTIDQAKPVLGGASSDMVIEGGTVTLGATDTAAFSDDTLGNVTITGLPTNLTGFNGGTYTASSGTWVGSAVQFNALKFTTATAATSTLSITATTTGTDPGSSTTENYTLTVNPPNWAGDTLAEYYYYPYFGDEVWSSGNFVVPASGINANGGVFDLSVTASAIIASNFAYDGYWYSSSFNGFEIVDESHSIITGVTIDSTSNMTGLTASDISFGSDYVELNWNGLNFTTGTVVKLDLTFDPPLDPSLINIGQTLDGSAAAANNPGALTVTDGTDLALRGTIDNSGVIAVNGSSAQTGLEIQGNVTLQGGGQIELSQNNESYIFGSDSSATLTNLDNTILGGGDIGAGSLNFTNAGIIADQGPEAIVVDTGASPFINTGTLETNGGTIMVESATTGGGNALIAGGTLELFGAADTNVSFSGPSLGTLALDQSQNFTGTVGGFSSQDQIDLGDIGFSANTALAYAANDDNSGGTLSVNDGTHTANIALLGQYMAGSFAMASDGHGGTLITAPPVGQEMTLAQAH